MLDLGRMSMLSSLEEDEDLHRPLTDYDGVESER